MSQAASRPDPVASDVAKAAIGFAGLAMCITLMYLGMRAVMDIGGACAEGGPYVPRVECPSGAPLALVGGMFGWFGFAAVATMYGTRIGGIWAGAPVLAWSGLFLALGWNFLSYGVLNPPGDEGVIWGWALCAVIFLLMGGVPLLGLAGVAGLAGQGTLYGNARPPKPASPRGTFPLGPTPAADEDMEHALRAALAAASSTGAAGGTSTAVVIDGERAAELTAIATNLTSAVNEGLNDLADDAPADPLARAMEGARAPGAAGEPGPAGFEEGTQALLDRLERLADLRDRGLLAPDEYEVAKETIVKELEGRA